jgi:hypothetical protein
VSVNYGPSSGNLKGKNLGLVAFKVVEVTKRTGALSSSLPQVHVSTGATDEASNALARDKAGSPRILYRSRPTASETARASVSSDTKLCPERKTST